MWLWQQARAFVSACEDKLLFFVACYLVSLLPLSPVILQCINSLSDHWVEVNKNVLWLQDLHIYAKLYLHVQYIKANVAVFFQPKYLCKITTIAYNMYFVVFCMW